MSPRRPPRAALALLPLALLACASPELRPARTDACAAVAGEGCVASSPARADAEPAALTAPPEASPDDRAVHVEAHGHECSGALITPDQVLTARHCVRSGARALLAPTEVRVAFGGVEAPWGRVTARALLEGDCSADVVLVVLDRPVTGLRPYAVRQSTAPLLGEPLEAIGYGSCAESEGLAPRHVTRLGVPSRIDAFRLVLRVGICPGDSGSPLVVAGTDEVVGLVTAGGGWNRWPVGDVAFTYAERLDDLPRMFARAGDPAATDPGEARDGTCIDRRARSATKRPMECFGGWCE